jgi:hypothetical protein
MPDGHDLDLRRLTKIAVLQEKLSRRGDRDSLDAATLLTGPKLRTMKRLRARYPAVPLRTYKAAIRSALMDA